MNFQFMPYVEAELIATLFRVTHPLPSMQMSDDSERTPDSFTVMLLIFSVPVFTLIRCFES